MNVLCLAVNRFIQELKRRNVIKATISYVVFAYAILEIANLLFPIVGIDKASIKIVLIVLIIAFPLWVAFAYIYEWTPDGFRKTDAIPEEEQWHRQLLLSIGNSLPDFALVSFRPKYSGSNRNCFW